MSAARTVAGVVALAAVGAVAGCTSGVDTRGLDQLFTEIPDDEPGCAAALYDDDGIVWTSVRGLADTEERLLITNDTVFNIGPVTQQFTAVALLSLVRDGKLDLGDPVRRYLPQLPDWADTVTIKHVLQRSSGIPDHYGPRIGFELPDGPVDNEGVLAALTRLEELDFEPGSQFGDSWTENVLQAQIVEAVDGRPLPEFLAEEVFPAAGIDAEMTASAGADGVAQSYTGPSGGPVVENRVTTVGDVGIHTTASELAEWGRQYWDPTVEGEDFLKQRTPFMIEPSGEGSSADEGELPQPGRWGYFAGVFADVDRPDAALRIQSPPGGYAGFVADLVALPEKKLAAAVLCNHEGHDPKATADALLTEYLEAS